MQNEHPTYRPDIDGLRAIAILLVVAYHAFPLLLTGGFVGVDVFFVISGFLIASIIIRSLELERFSFLDFYARRIRRIFPALIVVLATSYVIGWHLLLADEFKQLGLHIAAGTGFVQNFVLISEAGYFDIASELKPLVHLWSLSIEEQYYLFFPLLVWGAWKSGLNSLSIISLLALVSFALNLRGIESSPSTTFFLPQTRVWELLVGALLAHLQLFKAASFSKAMQRMVFHPLVFLHPPSDDRKETVLNNILASAGLALVLGAALWVNRTMHYPGGLALLPVLGTSFLIAAGPSAWINRKLLSNRVMVAIGLISYPLYLWHWPLLSFAKIMENEVPNTMVTVLALAISLVLACATYIFLEKPLRFGTRIRIKTLGLGLVLFAVIVGAAGFYTNLNDGLSFRKFAAPFVFEGDLSHEQFYKHISEKYFTCRMEHLAGEAPGCYESKKDEDVDTAIIGDSHAEHLFPGLADQLPNKNVAVYSRSRRPFTSVFKNAVESKSIKTVIFSASWARNYWYVPKNSTLEDEILKVANALIQSGKQVYLTDDIPFFEYSPKGCKVNRSLSEKANCSMGIADARFRKELYMPTLLNVLRRDPRIKLIQTYKHFCDKSKCSMVNGSEILYRDKDHLNLNGSRYLAKKILEENPGLRGTM